MKKLDDDLSEIDHFISNWSIKSPIDFNKTAKAKLKSSYKQFHALLIWGLIVERSFAETDPINIHFTECLSDLSHALLLSLSGFYKPARSSLRGAIENSIRVLLLRKNINISSMKSVFDMFHRVKTEFSSDLTALSIINKLHELYAELCKSVHSAKIDYMSLSVPFEKLNEFQENIYLSTLDMLRSSSSLLNQLIFWELDNLLSVAGHTNEDMVRDALPRSIKRAKIALS